MKTELTKRDEKLLVFLGVFLVVVAAGWFLVRPMLDRLSSLQDDIFSAEMHLSDKQAQLSDYSAARQEYNDALAASEKRSRSYYTMLSSEEIDRLLTTMVVKNDLRTQELTITAPDGIYTSLPYPGSRRYQALAGKSKAASDSEQNSGSVQVTGTKTPGVYVAGVELDVTGTETAIRRFLNSCMDENPALRVSSFSWMSTEENGAGTSELQMELALYMADLQNLDEMGQSNAADSNQTTANR